jgi:hypothetical protein
MLTRKSVDRFCSSLSYGEMLNLSAILVRAQHRNLSRKETYSIAADIVTSHDGRIPELLGMLISRGPENDGLF